MRLKPRTLSGSIDTSFHSYSNKPTSRNNFNPIKERQTTQTTDLKDNSNRVKVYLRIKPNLLNSKVQIPVKISKDTVLLESCSETNLYLK